MTFLMLFSTQGYMSEWSYTNRHIYTLREVFILSKESVTTKKLHVFEDLRLPYYSLPQGSCPRDVYLNNSRLQQWENHWMKLSGWVLTTLLSLVACYSLLLLIQMSLWTWVSDSVHLSVSPSTHSFVHLFFYSSIIHYLPSLWQASLSAPDECALLGDLVWLCFFLEPKYHGWLGAILVDMSDAILFHIRYPVLTGPMPLSWSCSPHLESSVIWKIPKHKVLLLLYP